MADTVLNMDSMPDSLDSQLNETDDFKLKIIRAEKIIAATGSQMLQLDLEVVGTNLSVKFDNTVITKADGSMNTFGTFKLKKLLNATKTHIEGDFGIQMAATMLKNKTFLAKLTKKETNKGTTVFELGNPNTFKPIEEPTPTVSPDQMQLELPQDEVISTEDW